MVFSVSLDYTTMSGAECKEASSGDPWLTAGTWVAPFLATVAAGVWNRYFNNPPSRPDVEKAASLRVKIEIEDPRVLGVLNRLEELEKSSSNSGLSQAAARSTPLTQVSSSHN